MSILFLLFAYTNALALDSASLTNSTAIRSKLLLISFDGFRHDYLEMAVAKGINISGFQRIWQSGFRVMRVQPEFITKTAPNHYSMVTGQHVETHGLVNNKFFDPDLNKSFSLKNPYQETESVWFDTGAEPIWVTNQLHGHRTGVTAWAGALATIKGILPSVSYPGFDKSMPLWKSIDDVIGWLESDINLALLYNVEPDQTGHEKGSTSIEVLQAIERLNHDVEYLLDKVERSEKLNGTLNIILTSDHGMADVAPERVVVLNDFLNDTMYTSPGKNYRVVWDLWPHGDFTADDLIYQLRNRHPKMNVYRKEEIPRRLFYSQNRRIAPVVLYAEVGWLIVKSKQDGISLKRRATHGYDPAAPEMGALLLATGPGFRPFPPNHTIPFMKLIDIYPMMCQILGLDRPGPHNGSLARVSQLLRSTIYKPAVMIPGATTRFSPAFGLTYCALSFPLYPIPSALIYILFFAN